MYIKEKTSVEIKISKKKGIDKIINIRKLMFTKRCYIESVLKVDAFCLIIKNDDT